MKQWGLAMVALLLLLSSAHAQMGERVALPEMGGLQIDRTEVTIGQFARYVRPRGCAPAPSKKVVALNMWQAGSAAPVGPGANPMAYPLSPTCPLCT